MKYCLSIGKNGPAAYLSHLEWTKAIERALRRSGLRVEITQGFNRHFRISFNGALSVGEESDGEFVEVCFSEVYPESEIRRKLGEQLPLGMDLSWVRSMEGLSSKIIGSDMLLEMLAMVQIPGGKSMGWLEEAANRFVAEKDLTIEIARKSGLRQLRLGDYLKKLSLQEIKPGEFQCSFTIFAGAEGSVKAREILQAFWRYAGLEEIPSAFQIKRKRYLVKTPAGFIDPIGKQD